MVERVVINYYKFFDETLQSSTFIVLFICMLVCLVWVIVPSANALWDFGRANIMQTPLTAQEKNIVIINGVSYEISFKEIK